MVISTNCCTCLKKTVAVANLVIDLSHTGVCACFSQNGEPEQLTTLINGLVILQCRHSTIDGNDGIVIDQNTQYKEHGKLLESGYIALQSEGQPIKFKNVQIKEFD